MPRRSARLKLQPASNVGHSRGDSTPTDSEPDYEREEEGSTAAVTRRDAAKAKQKTGRQRIVKRGILKRLSNMPLDILFEVTHFPHV